MKYKKCSICKAEEKEEIYGICKKCFYKTDMKIINKYIIKAKKEKMKDGKCCFCKTKLEKIEHYNEINYSLICDKCLGVITNDIMKDTFGGEGRG